MLCPEAFPTRFRVHSRPVLTKMAQMTNLTNEAPSDEIWRQSIAMGKRWEGMALTLLEAPKGEEDVVSPLAYN